LINKTKITVDLTKKMFIKTIAILIALAIKLSQGEAVVIRNASLLNRGLPVSAIVARQLLNTGNTQPPPRIQYEAYKALAGETVRLECPEPNPTWFFRRANLANSRNAAHDYYDETARAQKEGNGAEDLIVTRHGVINADYKYKIMCHVTLKHKVIVVNNVDFEDEGLYTCLYNLPTSGMAGEVDGGDNVRASSGIGRTYQRSSLFPLLNADAIVNPDGSPVQYRYVFNVSVYSKLFVFR
jgi:hypothetical protein